MSSNQMDKDIAQPTRVKLTFDNWVGLVGLVIGVTGALYAAIDSRFDDVESAISDHEVRLTKREANAFTAQEANALSNAVTKLSIEIVQQEKSMELQREHNQRMVDKLERVEASLRDKTPSDVFKVVEEIRELVRNDR